LVLMLLMLMVMVALVRQAGAFFKARGAGVVVKLKWAEVLAERREPCVSLVVRGVEAKK
jgi:hypothetical protein